MQQRMEGAMTTSDRNPNAGCSWIVDQLIGIRDLEQQLIADLASRDPASRQIRSRLGQLDRWVDMLNTALEASSPAADQNQPTRRPDRCICLYDGSANVGRHTTHAGVSFQRGRRGSPLRRAG
jgi:hypothetical protein